MKIFGATEQARKKLAEGYNPFPKKNDCGCNKGICPTSSKKGGRGGNSTPTVADITEENDK